MSFLSKEKGNDNDTNENKYFHFLCIFNFVDLTD